LWQTKNNRPAVDDANGSLSERAIDRGPGPRSLSAFSTALLAVENDLGRLGNQAAQLDPSLEPLVDRIVDLSKYAWMFRYPGDPIEPSTEEAREVLDRAKAVVDEVRGRIFGLDPPAAETQSG
jgi:HEPN domain